MTPPMTKASSKTHSYLSRNLAAMAQSPPTTATEAQARVGMTGAKMDATAPSSPSPMSIRAHVQSSAAREYRSG